MKTVEMPDELFSDYVELAHAHNYALAPNGPDKFSTVPTYVRRAQQDRADRQAARELMAVAEREFNRIFGGAA